MAVSLKGDRIPSEHHVGLHCAPGVFLDRDADGRVMGVSSAALRADPDGISVNWLEHHEGQDTPPFDAMSGLLKAVRKVKASHLIGMMAVADIEATPGAGGAVLHVEHDPLGPPKPNPGHSLIKGVGRGDAHVLYELSLLINLREFA